MTAKYTLGVVGGSGLYEMDGLTNVRELHVDTPYGKPSDAIIAGTFSDGTDVLFLPRHGRGHKVAPHEINYRANVAAMKIAGATHLLSVSAVGSMKEHIAPGDFVVIDQLIDLTKKRISTFFEDGIVGHVGFSDPICSKMADAVASAADSVGAKVHRGGTYVCMEGPQFSSRAESLVYRSWGVSVIGMTAMPEAKLAREAELPYAVLALATDYDSWHEGHDAVTVDQVVATMKKNVERAKQTIGAMPSRLPLPASSRAFGATKGAVMTAPEAVTAAAKARLSWLLGKG